MEKLVPILEQLAKSLNVTTEYLWSALLKQAFIDGVVSVVQFILIIISNFVLVWGSKKVYSLVENSDWDELNYLWIGSLALIVIILDLAAFFSFDTLLACFLNPEYWALEKILSKFKM